MKMKIVWLTVALSVGMNVLAAVDAFDRTAAEGAAKLVLASVAEEVLAGGEGAKTNLVGALLGDPARFRSAELAKTALKDPYRRDLERRYAAEAERVLARLARPRSVAEAFPAAFREQAARLPDGAAEHSVAEVYPRLFTAARAEACAAQAKTLSATVHPTEAEVDSISADELRRLLVERLVANQKVPVFEENVGFISEKLAVPIIEEAQAQKRRQAEAVRRMHPLAYAPGAIGREFVKNLGDTIRAEIARAKSGEWVYGFFPSVTNAVVRECAEKAALQHAADGVGEVTFEVAESEVLADLARDPAAHAKRGASEKLFAAKLAEQVREAGIAAAVARAPAAEREEFAAYVRGTEAKGKGPLAAAVRRRVADDLMPKVRAIREQGATKQFAATYPSVADGTWHPDGGLADSVCERHDYKIAVKGWRELPGLESVAAPGRGKVFLEETDGMADSAVLAAFDRARSARTAQLKAVQKSGTELGRKLKTMVGAGGEVPTLEEIVKELTALVESDWEAGRERVLWANVPAEKRPRNFGEQHRELFPSVKARIEEKAKALRESLEKPQQPDAPSDSKELLPVEVPCELVLDWRKGEIQVELQVDGKVRQKASCSADPAKYAGELKKIRQALAEELKRTLKTRQGTESVKFAVSVRNEFVYCGTAETLLRALAEAVGAIGIPIASGSDALGWTYGK